MSESPEHLDPKETTEARLCAFLEGELPPAEQLEIEKHLKANPQHRQLLIDLAQTRDRMREIPAEPAPPELAEMIAAQMERSLLLDDHTEPSSTINRLPQYLLLAAIVTLVLGLGVLIAIMLNNNGKNYTIGPAGGWPSSPPTLPKAATTMPVAVAFSDQPKPLVDSEHLPAAAVSSPIDAAATPAVDQKKLLMQVAGAGAPKASDLVMDESLDRDKVERLLRDQRIATSFPTVYLRVTSPSPAATSDQVRRFFGTNQVSFDDDILRDRTASTQLAMITPSMNSQRQNPGIASNVAALGLQPQAMQHGMARYSATTQQSETAYSFIAAKMPGEIVYVGHGLTPAQLQLLQGALSTGGVEQNVRRLDLAPPSTTQESAGLSAFSKDSAAISKGQTLTITVPQLVGPGIEKTNVVKVADDGTINLPMLDPLPAAGESPAELQDRVAGKYREANLIAAAAVSVAVNAPATQPTSQPAIFATTNPTTRPATSEPAALLKATSQPVDDGKLDVVVDMQKSN